ncbi:MAG: three-Cys-motif partner protein TcmP [Sphaerochaetaceae bacterium]|nr:three-Cys-motif partner protein TcmP [Sphaerochaetaceae bacterium]
MGTDKKTYFEKKKEWSKVKDKLLDIYLKAYFPIIAHTKRPTIYFDFFAGAGYFSKKENDFLYLENDKNLDNLEFYGSPLIAMKNYTETLHLTKPFNYRVSFYFIEKIHFNLLNDTINNSKFKNLDHHIIEGSCTNQILKLNKNDDIIQKFKNYNVFCYIDPFGIKNLHFKTLQTMKELNPFSLEFLINFNVHGLFRTARACKGITRKEKDFDFLEEGLIEDDEDLSSKKGISLLDSVFGSTKWQNIVIDFGDNKISGAETRKKLVSLYKNQIKINLKLKHVMALPVRFREKGPCKYHMIFATNNTKAACKMGDNMSKRNEFIDDYLSKGQLTFDFIENIDRNEANLLLEGRIKSILEQEDKGIPYTLLKTNLYCKYGPMKNINEVTKKLERKGFISVMRNKPITPTGKKATYLDEINGNSAIISLPKNRK